jgi:hypothetical protein
MKKRAAGSLVGETAGDALKPAPAAITYSYLENGKENSPRRKGRQDKFEV